MKFIILASGSLGNSTLIVGDKGNLLLIDAGISYKQIKDKIEKYGYNIENIETILLTHNHVDHIKGIESFKNKQKYSLVNICDDICLLEKFTEKELKGFKVRAIPLSHDVKCCGYIIRENEETLVYITDTGYVNQKLFPYIQNADYYIFESNHDVKMLLETSRPYFIKNRILGDEGHLSNEVASEILCDLVGNKTKQIFLAHISREANTKDLALETFYNVAKKRKIQIKDICVKAADQMIDVQGGKEYEKISVGN